MELDEWDLSAEQLESLEKDALRQIALRKNSNSNSNSTTNFASTTTTTTTPTVSGANSQLPPLPNSLPSSSTQSFKDSSRVQTQADGPSGSRVLPSSVAPKTADDSSKEEPKHSVKFFLHASGNIAIRFPYNQVLINAVKKIPKATWNAKERLWIIPLSSLSTAEDILRETPGLKIEVENLDPLVRRAITAATAAPDLQDRYDNIPSYIETKLLPFQREGVRFVLQRGGRALIADEMGLGKTLQAIAVALCVREAWPVLVLTPSSLRLHWASMIHEWLKIPPSDIVVLLSQCSGSNRGGFSVVSTAKGTARLDGLFNIVSYDSVPKLQGTLMASEFKVVIADESHYLKNAQAKRTAASLPVIGKAQYAILLSGTPALSRPIELFKQLESLYPSVYKNVHDYGNRYCRGGVFGLYQGSSNHEELHNLMKATLMIRRLKKDVLYELPVKRRQQVFLDLAEKDLRQIKALFLELGVVKDRIKASSSKDEQESLKFTQKGLINKIYTDSAEAKIPAVKEYLGTVIEAGCKFLIFAHHQPMIEAIHQFLQKKKVGCIRIDGGTPAASRQSLVTEFQENEAIKAAVLSIKAGGVGLTLTAASTVIFAELSWTPGDLIQAEDRAHRIGQVSSVNVYYLLANDTVDDIIWDVVQSKLENLGQVLDGQENTMEVSSNLPRSSPAKQKILSSHRSPSSSPQKQKTLHSSPTCSPMKQKTLDGYLKRCGTPDTTDAEPSLKHPRN
ncbi:SWI/SNF-related matrix-associated actin-dependent regulator of chromatin subfamily A-like protein 1 [Chenopodium quinoa]|uniref:SWI/SNF-related matrix-associated actin-dependent regulator of chromatin subfamily A-like protein 1 n=1 Tax=Chenopodium quinoa TaxID=63459 RepID=UPI000B7760CA|nr:SWI/SNF-related matrix-associated actin-dependent regulator of chromatin subfamily A-like protein 1 [Chenopodium quinoa]